MAAAASITGTALGTIQGSWRPFTRIVVISLVLRENVCWGREIDGVGLIAARKIRGIPVVMPPRIPPA